MSERLLATFQYLAKTENEAALEVLVSIGPLGLEPAEVSGSASLALI